MVYPSAPWTLQGDALQTLQPVDIDRVRSTVPTELDIAAVFPGKTLAGIYLASYQIGSALIYSELIVVSALIRYADRLGAWISHIYVDNPDSVAGGREIWGLPKELAEFDWQPGKPHAVTVRQGDRVLCRLDSTWQLPGIPVPFALGGFSMQDDKFLWFPAKSSLRLSAIGASVQVPPESPFASLGLDQPWLSFYGDELQLTVGAPEVVGQREVRYSYS
jgi:acetoacetate decarboxylase